MNDKIRVRQFTNNRHGDVLQEPCPEHVEPDCEDCGASGFIQTPYFRMVSPLGVVFGGNFKSEKAAQKAADTENEKRRPR